LTSRTMAASRAPRQRSAVRRCNKSALIDYLISAGEQRSWYGDAERLGCLEIADKLNLCRLLYRQLAWFCSLETLVPVTSRLAPKFRMIGPVAQQPAGLWVMKSHAYSLAEVPHIADGITAALQTNNECHDNDMPLGRGLSKHIFR